MCPSGGVPDVRPFDWTSLGQPLAQAAAGGPDTGATDLSVLVEAIATAGGYRGPRRPPLPVAASAAAGHHAGDSPRRARQAPSPRRARRCNSATG